MGGASGGAGPSQARDSARPQFKRRHAKMEEEYTKELEAKAHTIESLHAQVITGWFYASRASPMPFLCLSACVTV